MSSIIQKLAGEDRRSIGKANEVVQEVLANPELFAVVFEGIVNQDPVIRMRCADVIEKVSAQHSDWLLPFKSQLINEVSKIEQKEVQWHVTQMFGYMDVTKEEKDKIIDILHENIRSSDSKIVLTFSLQTLADFALRDETIRPNAIRTIEKTIEGASPAIVSRGKKLLKKLREKV